MTSGRFLSCWFPFPSFSCCAHTCLAFCAEHGRRLAILHLLQMSSPPGVLPSIVMAPAHDPTLAVGTAALFTGVLLSLAYAFISTSSRTKLDLF